MNAPRDHRLNRCSVLRGVRHCEIGIMRFASSITVKTDPAQAAEELLGPLDARITPGEIDLACSS